MLVEVYDSTSKKFVVIKPPIDKCFATANEAIPVGNKIVVFFHNTSSVLCYAVDKDEWNQDSSVKALDYVNLYAKVPKLKV